MLTETSIRKELRELLEGGNAHLTFEDATRGLPPELRGVRPAGLQHSAWELLEHMRIAQSDILEFVRNPDHVSPVWPEGYWPESPAPRRDADWDRSIKAFRADREAILELLEDDAWDLSQPIPHGSGQTLVREALLVADHTAYHLGQLMLVRRLLGNGQGA